MLSLTFIFICLWRQNNSTDYSNYQVLQTMMKCPQMSTFFKIILRVVLASAADQTKQRLWRREWLVIDYRPTAHAFTTKIVTTSEAVFVTQSLYLYLHVPVMSRTNVL